MKLHDRLVSIFGDWAILVNCLLYLYGIFAFALFGTIFIDMFLQWHAPRWPFESLSDFLKVIRGIFIVGFVIGFFGVCYVINERH